MSLTYVITGASRGLGLEFVKQLSSKGHNVFALARNPEESEGLKGLIDNKKIFAIRADTTNESSIKDAVENVVKNAPEGVDVLINNAGISGDMKLGFINTSKDVYLKVFETNVCGTSDVTQAFLPLLRKRGKENTKKIMNMSSIIGSITDIGMANPANRMPALSVSKAALNMVTKMTANQLAKENFIVYASHPGWVKTDFGGKSAPVEPKDSIAGMLKVLEKLTSKDNGAFIDFKGKRLRW